MTDPVFDHNVCVASVATGDQQAFEALYHHEAPHMLALASSMLGDVLQAQTLLRDTFVLIWKYADSYDAAVAPARAWIYGILRDRALRIMRTPGFVRLITPQTSQARATASRVATTGMPAPSVLDGLNARQRQALVMAYYQGKTLPDIASAMACDINQTRSLVNAALTQIAQTSRT